MTRFLYRVRGSGALVLIFGLGFLVQSSAPPPAWAQAFHAYGYAENNNASNYTGVAQVRYDSPVDIPGTTNCQTYFLNPMYQTQWAIHGTGNWFELGTGHQCEGFEYWYGGYGYGGTWNPLFEQNITGSAEHTFYLYQTNIDGNLYWKLSD